MKNIENILKRFEKVDLTQINSIKLMNRYDVKFVLPINKLQSFIEQLSIDYKVLSIDRKFGLPYKTVYYDTPDLVMYLKHHNGGLSRHKIRHRTYLESNTGFLEVKVKTNKGQTIKERISQNGSLNSWSDHENEFVRSKAPYGVETLRPQVCVNYNRITFANIATSEKITIDMDLDFSNNEKCVALNNIVIVEVKQFSKTRTQVLALLRELNIKPFSLSKYCLGVNFLYPQIKKNNFKEKLITLNKIINDAPISVIAGI